MWHISYNDFCKISVNYVSLFCSHIAHIHWFSYKISEFAKSLAQKLVGYFSFSSAHAEYWCILYNNILPTLFTDIDECSDNTDNCHTNATCTDVDGSFTCKCNGGYEGNGTACTGE